jgi:hypothetical protein
VAGTSREAAARAIAYFEGSDDAALMHELLEEAAPRAKRAVGAFLRKGGEEAIPPPAEIGPAREPADGDEAAATVRATDDFPMLQALTRAIGRRLEAIEIAASADFVEGSRVAVPPETRYPAGEQVFRGTVRDTGTTLEVLLDNGESWRGPASLARLLGSDK